MEIQNKESIQQDSQSSTSLTILSCLTTRSLSFVNSLKHLRSRNSEAYMGMIDRILGLIGIRSLVLDEPLTFLDEIVKKVTSGKRRAHGRIHYRHFGFHDSDDEMYYNDDVYLLIYKESGEFDYGHSLRVEYVLKDKPASDSDFGWRRGAGKRPRSRTIGEDRQRILNDVNENL